MTQFRVGPMERTDLIRVDPSVDPLAPQEVYFTLDTETSKVNIEYRHQSETAVPMRVWHGIVRRWSIPVTADAKALSEAINAGKLDDVLTRIVTGSETVWDGNNHVCRMTEDAEAADAEVGEWFSGWADTLPDSGGLWDAGDWFGDYPPEEVTADSTDEELDALAERLDDEARADCVVLANTREYLNNLRDRLRDKAEE